MTYSYNIHSDLVILYIHDLLQYLGINDWLIQFTASFNTYHNNHNNYTPHNDFYNSNYNDRHHYHGHDNTYSDNTYYNNVVESSNNPGVIVTLNLCLIWNKMVNLQRFNRKSKNSRTIRALC